MSPTLFVFSALLCEAKPLIVRWKLKKWQGKHPFAIYANAERIVVVTGMGKVLMAGAMGYVLSLFPNRRLPVLINLGIAGHGQHDLGSLFLVDKIMDKDSGKNFYPQLPFNFRDKTTALLTLSKPESRYIENCLFDMEASAFYEMACKFSSIELIHCLKIVSDNAESSYLEINEDLVESWITQNLDLIDNTIATLDSLRKKLPEPDIGFCQDLLSQFHFTASNAAKLRNLQQRWHLMNPDCELDWKALDAKNAKDLIAGLQLKLAEQEFYL